MTTVNIDGYRTYLAERNGEADLLNRRLDRREEFFTEIEAHPIRSERTVDAEAFERGVRSKRPAKDLSPELAFLLATAKLNQAERFGVGLGETYGQQRCGPAAGTGVSRTRRALPHPLIGVRPGHLRPSLPSRPPFVRHAAVREDQRLPSRRSKLSVRWCRRNGWMRPLRPRRSGR